MRIKRLCLCVFVLMAVTFLAAPGFSKEQVVQSKWAATPPRIDGLSDDWSGEVYNYEKGIDYALSNDSSNLYILFIFKDPGYLSSINFTGMTIWLNSEGKKKSDLGVRFFRKQVTADELIAILEKEGQVLSEAEKAKFKANRSYFLFRSEVINKNVRAPAQAENTAQTELPVYRAMVRERIVTYECRIPFSSLGIQPSGLSPESEKGLKIGFEWGGMTKEMREAMMANRASDASSARMTDSSLEQQIDGGGDEVGEGGPSLGFTRGPKKYSFWIDVKLAQNQ
jgi:hypothetical protein